MGDTVGNFSATDANGPHNIIDYYTCIEADQPTMVVHPGIKRYAQSGSFDYEEQTTRSIRCR